MVGRWTIHPLFFIHQTAQVQKVVVEFLPKESLVSDMPAGDVNVANLFFTVYFIILDFERLLYLK